MDFKVTNSFSREDLNYEKGEVKNIHYGDIHTQFQTLFDLKNENVPFINTEISLSRISEDFYCKEGDLVFADASENLDDVGKSIEIVNLNNEKLLAGLHTLLARPKDDKIQKGFNGSLFKSKRVRIQIQKEAQGSKVLSINVGRLSNVKLFYPSILEQQKISSILSLIDERITTQKKIIENLESLMKGLRKKIFSQKIRFKEANGKEFENWRKRTLGEISEKKASNISANKLEFSSGKYKIYGASGILKKVDFFTEHDEYISIVKDGAGVGRLFICESESSVLGTMDIIKSKAEINLHYLFYHLCDINFTQYVSGSTIPHIYFKDYKKEIIKLPSIQEQKKIAQCFRFFSKKIEIEKELLVEFEEQKKHLLSNLFI